jgi:PAS domain S-box-containing protein
VRSLHSDQTVRPPRRLILRAASSFARIFVAAIAYYAAGRLGLLLAIPPGYASAFWPSSGIALAAVLLWGNRVWPGIALASFLVNAWTPLDGGISVAAASRSAVIALGIASGATLQALTGAHLIRRFVGFPTALTEERAIGKFLVLGGPASCMVNASISVTILLATGAITLPQYLFSWSTWWIGDTIGVLLVTPLVLIWTAEPRPLWRRRRSHVAIPLMICSALVIAFFVYASNREQRRINSGLALRANMIADRVSARLATYSEVIHGVASFLESMPTTDRPAFRAFAARSLERNAGFRGLGWSPRVPDRERRADEDSARHDGFPSFRIWEYSPDGGIAPAARRREYVPVLFLEPLPGNEVALGFDLASEATLLPALEHARDTGRLVVSDRTSVVRETGTQHDVLAFLAVYGGTIGTVQERRTSLRGFCLGTFRINDVLAEALRGVDIADIDVSVVDASRNAVVPLVSLQGSDSELTSNGWGENWHIDRPMQFGQRDWILRFSPHPEYAFKQRSLTAWAVLASGLFLISLLGAFLLVVTGRSIAVATLVDVRTAALRQAEERYRGLVESAPDAMVIINDSAIVLVNARTEQLFGYSREHLVGQKVEILIPDRYRERHGSHRTGYLQAPKARHMGSVLELFGRRSDGSEFPVEISLSPTQSKEGLLVTATVRDITERKQLETERLQTLREKETMLKEIHHRVKNNLQVVSSLFYLQSRRTEDSRFRQLLDESRDRVQSIALIHDRLYRSESLASIEFVGYLRSLVTSIKATYGDATVNVDVAVTGRDVCLDVDHAVPCGLIVSELVSNAFKHAFPAGRVGKIEVHVHKEHDGEVVLEVADDGVGIPESVAWRQAQSLGLQLVASLTVQLRAISDLDSSRGTRFKMRFSPA